MAKDWVLVSPDGTRHNTENLTEFAREQGLNQNGLSCMAQGKIEQGVTNRDESGYGWQCYYAENYAGPQEIEKGTPRKSRGEVTSETRRIVHQRWSTLKEKHGEGAVQAAQRELAEDVGLEVDRLKTLLAVEGLHYPDPLKGGKLSRKLVGTVREQTKHHFLDGVPGKVKTYGALAKEFEVGQSRVSVIAQAIDWDAERAKG